MQIFITSRLSNGNGLFPAELHLDNYSVTIRYPGLIASSEKTLMYKNITSVEVISPFIGFSKIIISVYNLDNLIVEGFTRRTAEEIKRNPVKVIEERLT